MAKKKVQRKTHSRTTGRRGAARAMWKGAISFGLVTIPVALRPATVNEELKFRLLRKSDLSPVNYKRVAAVDGKEVPWGEIVKGYEYEKGKFIVLKEEDFRRVDLEATETIDIVDFVAQAEINPIFYLRPYYLEPQRGGGNAYGLLREVLARTGKVGIAKVVIKTRQHLAALKANGPALVLELMHFSHELVSPQSLDLPEKKEVGKREVAMAAALVDQMTISWDPARYTDDYTSALLKLIHRKVERGGEELPAAPEKHRPSTNVIDLVSVLQESLNQAGKGARTPARKGRRRAA